MWNRNHPLVALLVAALLGSGTASPVRGQAVAAPGSGFLAGTHLGFGYVANAPDQLVGFGLMTVGSAWSGWGGFANLKLTASPASGDEDFVEGTTAAEAELRGDDPFGEAEDAWTTVSVGLVRALGPEVAVYAGGGWSQETVYQEYERQGDAGADRFFIVEDRRVGGDTVNLLGGFYFRATRSVVFQMGGETAPAGFTAGVSFVVPLGA